MWNSFTYTYTTSAYVPSISPALIEKNERGLWLVNWQWNLLQHQKLSGIYLFCHQSFADDRLKSFSQNSNTISIFEQNILWFSFAYFHVTIASEMNDIFSCWILSYVPFCIKSHAARRPAASNFLWHPPSTLLVVFPAKNRFGLLGQKS